MAAGTSTSKPTIECLENGPYRVSGLETLTGTEGEAIVTKSVVALCRCGGSNNKPFCDGTHAKNGFKSEKLPGRVADKRDTYVGKGITIHDNRGLCAHAGYCTDALPTVWRMKQEPWIDADGSDVAAIIETVRKCPSGALSYSIEGAEQRDQDRPPATHPPAIGVMKGGPYRVTGDVELKEQVWGDGASREQYTLCRCGGSKNKPFCDGSHWDIKFDANT
jgi:CDGSH-type Zn-finger protein